MRQPSLYDSSTHRGRIHKVLLVAPVNTLANWEAEFNKWTAGMNQKVKVYNLGDGDKRFREKLISQWDDEGGVLIASDGVFRVDSKIKDLEGSLLTPGPDAVVLDEWYVVKDLEVSGEILWLIG
jgi:SNF2-related domain